MKIPRLRAKAILLGIILVSSVSGYALGIYVSQPQRYQITIAFSQTLYVWGHIHIEVFPMAYPTPGQSWTINVYSVNVTSGKVSFTPSANSTVAVYVVDSGRIKTYNLLVDAQGSADFRYSPSESDIAFVAFSGNYSSEKIVFSAHYVPSDVIDTMLLSSSLMSGATGITGGLAVRGKRSRWLLFGLLVLTLSLFSLVIIGSLYSRFFLETVWGYPENVFSGFVTLSLLRYLTISGFLLFSALAFVVLVLHLKKKKMTKDDNPRRR